MKHLKSFNEKNLTQDSLPPIHKKKIPLKDKINNWASEKIEKNREMR